MNLPDLMINMHKLHSLWSRMERLRDNFTRPDYPVKECSWTQTTFFMDGIFYVAPLEMYRFIFQFGVDEGAVKAASGVAIRRLNFFIDNLHKK